MAGLAGQKPGDFISQTLAVTIATEGTEKVYLTIDQILK
jgi:hypothetical protein